MQIQAITGNAAQVANNVLTSMKNVKKNISLAKMTKDSYVSQRLEASADNIFKSVKSDKQFKKMYAKIEKRAIEDFPKVVEKAKKQLKTAGIAAGVAVGLLALGVGIKKIVQNHNAKKEAKQQINEAV